MNDKSFKLYGCVSLKGGAGFCTPIFSLEKDNFYWVQEIDEKSEVSRFISVTDIEGLYLTKTDEEIIQLEGQKAVYGFIDNKETVSFGSKEELSSTLKDYFLNENDKLHLRKSIAQFIEDELYLQKAKKDIEDNSTKKAEKRKKEERVLDTGEYDPERNLVITTKMHFVRNQVLENNDNYWMVGSKGSGKSAFIKYLISELNFEKNTFPVKIDLFGFHSQTFDNVLDNHLELYLVEAVIKQLLEVDKKLARELEKKYSKMKNFDNIFLHFCDDLIISQLNFLLFFDDIGVLKKSDFNKMCKLIAHMVDNNIRFFISGRLYSKNKFDKHVPNRISEAISFFNIDGFTKDDSISLISKIFQQSRAAFFHDVNNWHFVYKRIQNLPPRSIVQITKHLIEIEQPSRNKVVAEIEYQIEGIVYKVWDYIKTRFPNISSEQLQQSFLRQLVDGGLIIPSPDHKSYTVPNQFVAYYLLERRDRYALEGVDISLAEDSEISLS